MNGQDINILTLIKGKERYTFVYDSETRLEALRQLGRFATDPDLSFTWYDAAVVSQKMREEERAEKGLRITHPIDY